MIIILFSIVFVDFVFARGLDEKKYCTYSFTLVNKKIRSFVRSFSLRACVCACTRPRVLKHLSGQQVTDTCQVHRKLTLVRSTSNGHLSGPQVTNTCHVKTMSTNMSPRTPNSSQPNTRPQDDSKQQ